MLALQTLLLSTALLLALLLNLALKPSFSAKLNTAALSLAVLGGLVFYSVGFAEATGNLIISVVRTPYAVLRMFLGLNDLPTIEKTSLLSTNAGLVCFWVLHMLAFYSITSAVMTTLGAELLRTLRFFLSHRGDLTLIYGISPDSIALGKECLRDKAAVVFIADKPENADSSVIQDLNNQGMAAATGGRGPEPVLRPAAALCPGGARDSGGEYPDQSARRGRDHRFHAPDLRAAVRLRLCQCL